MVFLTQYHRGFHLIHREVPAGPDHVAIMSAPEAVFRRNTAFGLACATRTLDFLEEFDAIAFLPEPIDSLGRNIGVYNNAATSVPGSHNDHSELVPKLREMTAIASGNSDVEHSHGSISVARRRDRPQAADSSQ
jgi:hypothetical protein